MSKDSILEQYLNRVSYGSSIRGAESAAWRYFHKHASDLSLAESAFLAGLPNAPTLLNPYTHPSQARSRQMLVLRRMRDRVMITQDDFERASAQTLQLRSPEAIFRAPHVCDMIVKQYDAMHAASVTTTIDEALQEELMPVIETHLALLKKRNVTNAAVVVIENRTGEVRALVGSRDYFNDEISGQVNGATALRQPGSAIKPLMYALAVEEGRTAAEIVPDIPTAIPDIRGDYVPENYDKQFHGPVSIRTALACSYNVPAVRVLESIGKEVFLQKLRMCGFTSLTGTSDYYGYGLTLGNAEVSLVELTNAYRILANKGEWSPLVLVKEAKRQDGQIVTIPDVRPSQRVYSEQAAFLISDILSDASARAPAFGKIGRAHV
jgi:penicillin-binding protein 1C